MITFCCNWRFGNCPYLFSSCSYRTDHFQRYTIANGASHIFGKGNAVEETYRNKKIRVFIEFLLFRLVSVSCIQENCTLEILLYYNVNNTLRFWVWKNRASKKSYHRIDLSLVLHWKLAYFGSRKVDITDSKYYCSIWSFRIESRIRSSLI